MLEEILDNCKKVIIPYWKGLIDREYGGYFGYVDFDLTIDRRADKGVILNSRILYFFSRAALIFEDNALLEYADWAYHFLIDNCWDKEYGGVYWMLEYDGSVKEAMKHTYNQAFAIYALSTYYEAIRKDEALEKAMELFHLIENKCVDEYGYMEAFTRDWQLINNEKLSENGLLADKTMNTLLHLLEAYTLLYHVSADKEVGERLTAILDLFKTKVWNAKEGKLEVFFDREMNSIADLYSYGHDIEASWLIDYAYMVLNGEDSGEQTPRYTTEIAENILNRALEGGAVNNECFCGELDRTRVWWVQAESVVGFFNAYEKTNDPKFLEAATQIWEYIKKYFVDSRENSEWFWDLDENGNPVSRKPITEPWKCPYHNGRMCFEILVRQRRIERKQSDADK